MRIMLALLAARALLATSIYPIAVTGVGSFSKSSWDAGVYEAFDGDNGTDSVSVFFSAGGAAATINNGINMNPVDGSEASIDGLKSYYFSFSLGDNAFLKLLDASGHMIASAPLSGWVVMDDRNYVDPLHPFIGYNQGFSIVSVPEPGMAWLVGLAMIGMFAAFRSIKPSPAAPKNQPRSLRLEEGPGSAHANDRQQPCAGYSPQFCTVPQLASRSSGR